ncbi:polyunsaturated fatty acid lipoxygenase ALOX15B-like [Brachyhypopomus gauderio]|uniref:polyunsaturated fatty acid lipoxygenase ALOX15B-like n=1 Tax=Brachyhypopomus gauderio TaxID=698409 RepID=UPI004041F3A8
MEKYKIEVFTGDSGGSGTINYISIRLIGTKSSTEPQILNKSSVFKKGEKKEFTVECQPSLGTLLLLELESEIRFFYDDNWFCSKLIVTTPEGTQHHFPCYQWLDSKHKILLRDTVALLRNKEAKGNLLDQRQQNLEERCKVFRWREFLPGLPNGIDASIASQLPPVVQFSLAQSLNFDITGKKIMGELKWETWFHHSDVWNNLEELHHLFHHHHTKTFDYVKHHWDSDEFFGYQLLNGLNPMMIQCCSELPPNFPVTDDMVKFSLKKEMKNGNIFLCDYKRLKGFEGIVINNRQQYVAAPLCLLFSTPEKKLIPIAIQLLQDPGESNPIFLPTDSKWDWLLAKTFVRNAEFYEHELNFHLLHTHLFGEVITIATLRNLPSAHPLFKLLIPHTRYNLHINVMARDRLISSNGVFAKYTAIGFCGVTKFLGNASSSLTYSSLCLPDNIMERGVENIPNYYYRDDGLDLWNVINVFVQRVIVHYYLNDADVERDSELQNWIKEIFQNGFMGNVSTGIPQSLNKVDELVKFVTMVIFTVSAQHAAVNNGQFEFGGWMPNFPSTIRQPPPTRKGATTEQTVVDAMPDVNTTVNILIVLYTLSKNSSDHYPLGYYPEELFDDSGPRQAFADFKTDLDHLTAKIEKRNRHLKLPYTYLSPQNVDNSVAI